MGLKRAWLLLAGLMLVASLAWAWQQSGRPAELGQELSRAPSTASKLKNPYEGLPEAIAAGKKLFKRHCAECHGADARGRDRAPDLHSPAIQQASPGTLFWFLKNGDLKEGMPSWSRLPDERLWQLVSYLKTLG